MKISRTTLWILTIGIFAILLVAAGVIYNREKAEQRQLTSNIVQAQQNFTKNSEQKKDLEARLSQAKSRTASVQDEFRQYTESIEINKALFEIADDANVVITKLSCSIPTKEKLNNITYDVFSLNLGAEGVNIAVLLNFTSKLSKRFPTATIESVSISVEEKSTLTLRTKIYYL